MTPLQMLIKRVEDQMLNSATNNDQLYIVRAMAELLLEKEQEMFEDAYYTGYAAGKKKYPDILGYLETINEGKW